MLLHGSPFSPFVRKVLVLAHETGLAGRIEHRHASMTPVSPDPVLIPDNPLGKVPALVLDDGRALYDSRVICDYLDSLHDGSRMVPTEGAARLDVLRRQALADGLMDAAVLLRYETTLRPEALRWPDWVAGQWGKIDRTLNAMAAEAKDGAIDLGTLATACALAYLDIRFPEHGWRQGRDGL
ncbi:MAG: glutathione S-transferase N-terminal domain-containing protein, partial [Alphaproteobacteria bacterium]|nr:glutathione S-transferase N-terminal domain-containing protein [Alphaproteobacteria bacterium]